MINTVLKGISLLLFFLLMGDRLTSSPRLTLVAFFGGVIIIFAIIDRYFEPLNDEDVGWLCQPKDKESE